MRHRVRAAAIIIDEAKLLLVKHIHPVTGEVWWVPPGGGMEAEDDSLISCAKRETWEETGYHIDVDPNPVFVREYLDRAAAVLHLEIYFPARITGGSLTIANVPPEAEDIAYIVDARWLSLSEVAGIQMYPEQLRHSFELQQRTTYLGRQSS